MSGIVSQDPARAPDPARASNPAPDPTRAPDPAPRAPDPAAAPVPVWLRDEPEITALLNTAVDRFDGLPAEMRRRDVFVPIEPHVSSLARADAAADQLWKLIGELERLGVASIRRGRRGPYDPEWKAAKLAFPAASETVLRNWLLRERTSPESVLWREAIERRAGSFPAGTEALAERRVAIEGRSADEVVGAFALLGTVRRPATLRQLSAFAFWGDSKVLDERGDLIAALFPTLEIRERAIVVSVFLQDVCDGVLFIENQDTYTAACGGHPAEVVGHALVFASGFRSSAERVRCRDGALLHFAGPGASPAASGTPTLGGTPTLDGTPIRERFESWWFGEADALGPCSFWGDLDFAGMQILRSLRRRFGDVRAWRPGYEPMLAALQAQGGRLPIQAQARGQVDPGSTGCPYADDVLLPAIRQWGLMDQELPIGL